MKKTLALILALMMVLTLALASCGEKPEETEPTDDFFNVGGDNTEKGDATGEGDETGKTNGGSNTSSAGYTTVNDTVYVRFTAVLRSDDKVTSDKIAEVKFGTALNRVAHNKKWSKINYNGTEAYIATELITTSKAAVTFVEQPAETTAKVTNLGTAKNAKLRLYPMSASGLSVISDDDFAAASMVGQIPKDTVVTIVSRSEDGAWAYVKCEGYKAKSDGEYETTLSQLEGYCSTSVFDTNFGSGNNSGNSGGALG